MKPLAELLRLGRTIRVIGFDDAPFDRASAAPVSFSGVVCSGTRFEGMLWGRLTRDGLDATDALAGLLLGSKFHPQIHLVLIDGLGLGGFNLVDLPALAARVDRPCVAVMRRLPDQGAIRRALSSFPDAARRLELIRRAGIVHQRGGFTFQVQGARVAPVAAILAQLTDRGHVPEALRLAHLIGSAVQTGESGRRA